MKNRISIFLLISCITSINAQSNWILINKSNIKGSISGSITQGYIFNIDRDFYIINERTRQRVRTRNPEVQIYQNGSDYKLIIEDFDEPVICKKLNNVIETKISGNFEGWNGNTIFKMMNGQIWQQSSYSYKYHYSYSPNVFIYEFKGTWTMKIEDVDETIQVIRLK